LTWLEKKLLLGRVDGLLADRSKTGRTTIMKMRLAMGALGLLLVSPLTASPQPRPLPLEATTKPDPLASAVRRCSERVRHSLPQGQFAAHATLRGEVKSSGTDAELAIFRECMQADGHQGG
jgi:hypothetical protein